MDWAWRKIVLRNGTTHGGYKLVALNIYYYSYFFLAKNLWNPVLQFSLDNFSLKTASHTSIYIILVLKWSLDCLESPKIKVKLLL